MRCFTSKGLVYSSNLRVQALTGSFGGFRNRITYEIDGNKLEYGDQIEGSFYLVTNGGEKEIPYSFVSRTAPLAKHWTV